MTKMAFWYWMLLSVSS